MAASGPAQWLERSPAVIHDALAIAANRNVSARTTILVALAPSVRNGSKADGSSGWKADVERIIDALQSVPFWSSIPRNLKAASAVLDKRTKNGHGAVAMFSILLAAAAATAPIPDMTNDWWSNYYDTPSKGLAAGELSVVVSEITVNKRGHFENCVGRVYRGNPQMGPYVCSRLKMRALFRPARASDGSKVYGLYRKLIIVANVKEETRFRSPRFGIRIPAAGRSASHNPFEIQFYVGADGQVSDCSLVDAVGINLERTEQIVDPALVQSACAEVPTQLGPASVRDKRGNAVPSVQNALVTIDQPIEPRNQ